MSIASIFVVDIGTTRIKAAVFDMDNHCLGLQSIDMEERTGERTGEIFRNIDATFWLSALAQLARGLLTPAVRDGLKAVVISGNGPTILPIDREGKPLALAMTWLDRRAQKEAAEASMALHYSVDAAFNLPKILWIRHNNPSLYERTYAFVSCPEFVAGRLTGEWTTCVPNEGYTRIIWDDSALTALSLDREKFPRFVGVGEVVGYVHSEAEKLRLSEGCSCGDGGS